MSKLGVASVAVDPATVQPTEEDLRHDWISAFIDGLPSPTRESAVITRHRSWLASLLLISSLRS